MARHSTAADAQQQDTESEPRLWHGLIAFASIMLLLVGAFELDRGSSRCSRTTSTSWASGTCW